MARLKGKVALITGAAQGIGEAIAVLFASEGCEVILTDIQDERGKALSDQINTERSNSSSDSCGRSVYQHLDVTQEANWIAIQSFVETQFGRLDVLVNNAGITGFLKTSGPHDPENLDIDSWRSVMDVNLDGVAFGCKYGIQLMKASTAASIVNISSRSGLVGIPAATAYAASKAGVRNHTKSVALYCAEQGYPIRCNSIHPGAILTPMWDAMWASMSVKGAEREAAIQSVGNDVPLGKMGDPIDVAYAALYLASNEAKYVTGIELNIDGGILAGSTASPK